MERYRVSNRWFWKEISILNAARFYVSKEAFCEWENFLTLFSSSISSFQNLQSLAEMPPNPVCEKGEPSNGAHFCKDFAVSNCVNSGEKETLSQTRFL